jgi:ankyrin repeat protein
MKTFLPPLDPDVHSDIHPIYRVAHKNDIQSVRKYLEEGFDPNGRHPYYVDLMGIALAHDSVDFVKLLLEFGYDLNKPGPGGDFHLAGAVSSKRCMKVIQALIDGGADIHAKHLSTGVNAVVMAVGSGYRDAYDLLISLGADLSVGDDTGRPLLYYAVGTGHFEFAEEMLKKGMDINKPNIDQRTMLHIAAQKGDTAAVKWLLDHHADTQLKDKTKRTALDWAIANGREAVVALLS